MEIAYCCFLISAPAYSMLPFVPFHFGLLSRKNVTSVCGAMAGSSILIRCFPDDQQRGNLPPSSLAWPTFVIKKNSAFRLNQL
jgi:hypothetical protein